MTDSIKYREHLVKTQPDAENRWDNVQELINFASEVERTAPTDVAQKILKADEALRRNKKRDITIIIQIHKDDMMISNIDKIGGHRAIDWIYREIGEERNKRGFYIFHLRYVPSWCDRSVYYCYSLCEKINI